MSDQIFEDDVILLREAIPEHGLSTDRIGRIVQSVRLHEYEVEFGDYRAITAKVTLKRDQIQVLRHETTLNDRIFW